VPTPGPETAGYGGNTSCVELELDSGEVIVLDAGTGIRPLGRQLLDRGVLRFHLLLTHLHLDHLEGLRFFEPMWDERVTLDIWGPPSPVAGLRARIARAFSPPLFPVDLRDVPARLAFHDLPRQPWSIDGVNVSAVPVVHPGPTVGFRIEAGSVSLAYIPDHEPAFTGAIAELPRDWISGATVADGVDLLVHDAQYFEDEYEQRVGWGHSSVADTVAFSHTVGARQLLLFHHEPLHDDDSLERLGARARELAEPGEAVPELAREGLVLEL
jgi:phosphoribosyl 1,2-cyclic phosphodiesterase